MGKKHKVEEVRDDNGTVIGTIEYVPKLNKGAETINSFYHVTRLIDESVEDFGFEKEAVINGMRNYHLRVIEGWQQQYNDLGAKLDQWATVPVTEPEDVYDRCGVAIGTVSCNGSSVDPWEMHTFVDNMIAYFESKDAAIAGCLERHAGLMKSWKDRKKFMKQFEAA